MKHLLKDLSDLGEYAFVAVRPGRFDELAAAGNRRAMVARTVVRDPSRVASVARSSTQVRV